jgi:hypothetical protein
MASLKQLREIFAPILVERPDLVLQGRWLFRLPIETAITGLYIGRTAYAGGSDTELSVIRPPRMAGCELTGARSTGGKSVREHDAKLWRTGRASSKRPLAGFRAASMVSCGALRARGKSSVAVRTRAKLAGRDEPNSQRSLGGRPVLTAEANQRIRVLFLNYTQI